MKEDQANQMAQRIADKAAPALMNAWDRYAYKLGLTSSELWQVKALQVALKDKHGNRYDFELVAQAFKESKE